MTRVFGEVGVGPGWPAMRTDRALTVSVRYPHRKTVDGMVVEPVYADIRVSSNGQFSVDLEPGPVWWRIHHGGYRAERVLQVPSTETAGYESLVELDPSSLDPVAPPVPAWQPVTDDLQQQITDIETGASGPPGADGASAYEVAVDEGFVGDEAAWLASLVGPEGPEGPEGPQGAQGVKGDTGSTGAPGADGASAYEVAVDEGFVGDEAAWLASLVGPEGPEGPQGEPGTGGGSAEPGYTVGTYIPTPNTTLSTNTPAIGVMKAVPIYIRKAVTVDRIAMLAMGSDPTTVCRLGIYADAGDSRPGALVLDAGTVSLATSGFKAVTISQALTPGVYWLASVQQVGTNPVELRSFGPSGNPYRQYVTTDNPDNYSFSIAEQYERNGVTGALPATYNPTGTGGANSSVAMFLRTT